MLMYVRGVVLLRNFPLWGRIDLPYKRELESGQYVLTGSSEKKTNKYFKKETFIE